MREAKVNGQEKVNEEEMKEVRKSKRLISKPKKFDD